MSIIERNNHGAIAVNKNAIEKMIIEDMLDMSDSFVLCNKKGKLIKEKPTFFDPDYFDAVDVAERKNETKVIIYMIIKSGYRISEIADRIFDVIEGDFELLSLGNPNSVSVKVKGVMADEIIKRDIEVIRKYE